jgi:diguanylate cyclase (GGDEF)-like protein
MITRQTADDVVRRTFELSRRLARVATGGDVHRLIVKRAVAAVRAKQGSLAIFDPAAGRLRVPTTVGYPQALVDDVCVAPGEGVIGRVFTTRRPLLVADAGQEPKVRHRRARYRTPSFLAVPILAQSGPLGVLSVADRIDGQPFERRDLLVLRSLAASAALALQAHELSKQAGVLQQWATVDPVTGLFNRHSFERRLEEEIQRGRRHGLPLSLLLMDVDDFKRINDTQGHQAGDAALRLLGGIIRHSVRAFDICCRYGGEEFALVLPETDPREALASAQRIRDAVERQSLTLLEGRPPVQMTVSIGVATLARAEGARELVARADAALYQAKAAGKNQVGTEHSSPR